MLSMREKKATILCVAVCGSMLSVSAVARAMLQSVQGGTKCATPGKAIVDILDGVYSAEENNLDPTFRDFFAHHNSSYVDTHFYAFNDDIIDVPDVLNSAVHAFIYNNFNQLSWESGTGELGLHFYTDIKLSKYSVVYEDGIGLTSGYILLALIANAKQVQHYFNSGKRNIILNDQYFEAAKGEKSKFYVNVAGTDSNYLAKVQQMLALINEDDFVEIVYLSHKQFDDEVLMQQVFRMCDFINFDKGTVSQKYWPAALEYRGFNKQINFHHVGYLYPTIPTQKLSCLNEGDHNFSIIVYPIHEINKRFQNGALKVLIRKLR